MTLLTNLGYLVGVVTAGCVVGGLTIVGPERLSALRRTAPARLRPLAPELGLLAVVLIGNALVRERVRDVSWLIGVELTGAIYALEGNLVAMVQTIASPALTAVFAASYVYGYAFLLVFPLLAYAALADTHRLRELAIAYSLNYVLGLVLYVLFVAYGPRNLLADVEPLLYSNYPQAQILTSKVNTNTNVFPSLHVSLSVTVLLFAHRTRTVYPRWLVVAAPLATAVTVSTVYLGIHWVTDIFAGALLGAVCVVAAIRLAARRRGRSRHA